MIVFNVIIAFFEFFVYKSRAGEKSNTPHHFYSLKEGEAHDTPPEEDFTENQESENDTADDRADSSEFAGVPFVSDERKDERREKEEPFEDGDPAKDESNEGHDETCEAKAIRAFDIGVNLRGVGLFDLGSIENLFHNLSYLIVLLLFSFLICRTVFSCPFDYKRLSRRFSNTIKNPYSFFLGKRREIGE